MSGKAGEASTGYARGRMTMLQPIAPYLVLFMFILSIVFSMFPMAGGYMLLWALTGLIGVYFLWVSFPRGLTYGLWLLAIYILSGFAAFLFYGFVLPGGQGIAIGMLLEVLAGYVVYNLILEVKGIRDVIEGPRVTLGLWTIAVVLFFLASNGAMGGLAFWVRSGGNLYGYAALEVIMTLLVLYIFTRTELCIQYMEEGPMAVRRIYERPTSTLETSTERVIRSAKGVATRTRKAITPTRKGKGVGLGVLEDCPLCSSRLKLVKRACPNCGGTESTAVCEKSGHVYIPCPSCGKASFHGDYRCKKCDAKLGEQILCRKCGKEADLVDWRAVGDVHGSDEKEETSGVPTS